MSFEKLPPADTDSATLIEKPMSPVRATCIGILLSFCVFVECAMTIPPAIIAFVSPSACSTSTIPIRTWLLVSSGTWIFISCLSIAPLHALIRDGVPAKFSRLFGLNMGLFVLLILFNFAWGAFGASLVVLCPAAPELLAFVVLDMVVCPLIITWILCQTCYWAGCCE